MHGIVKWNMKINAKYHRDKNNHSKIQVNCMNKQRGTNRKGMKYD